MGEKQGYKQYINYFKKWDGAAMLGSIMMVVGFLILWLGLGWGYITYLLMMVGLFGGLAVFLYGSIGRKHEADFQAEVAHRAETITFRELEEDSHFRRRVPKEKIEERIFEAFDLCDGLYVKAMKNAALCSSDYTYAKMLYLNDAFYIKTLAFSFISDKKELSVHEIYYDSLEDVTVERDRKTITTVNNKRFLAKTCFLCLTYDGGKQLRLPAKDDIYTDEFAETLKRKYIEKK